MARKPKITSAEEMQKKIDIYFADCDAKNKPYTISGLAIACGFTNRQSLLNYQSKEAFFDTIKKAKGICERYAEEQLFVNKNVAGIIFNLKNNYGWKDKENIDENQRQTPIINISEGINI